MIDWELGVLYIDWRIPLFEFKIGRATKELVLKKMSEANLLTEDMEANILRMYSELELLNVVPVTSIHTPLIGPLVRKFNLIFNRYNLEEIEDVDLTIKYGLCWNVFLSEYPTGHHCTLMVSNYKDSKLIATLPESGNLDIGIGFCNMENWPQIKHGLQGSRKRSQEWHDKNVT